MRWRFLARSSLGKGCPLILDQSTKLLAPALMPMVPSWARELAPTVVEARSIAVAGGAASAEIEYSRGEGAAMVTAVVPHAARLSAPALRACVAEVFGSMLAGLGGGRFAHPVRMWTFVPGIHDSMGAGIDRYRVFNMGRHDAFTKWFGDAAALGSVLPAASAVGHDGEALAMCTLGLRTPGVAVENPRQTPALAYSLTHGPKPPCFTRAMVAKLPTGTRLLVSGTASIRGEDSLHAGSIQRQLDETFKNLDRLVQSVQGADVFSLDGVETARVYFPRATDHEALLAGVAARLPASATIEYVPAWICRAELLVEIEATLAPLPS